jgi:hypothetical protein
LTEWLTNLHTYYTDGNSGTVRDNVAACHRPARELFNRQSMMNDQTNIAACVRAHPHMRQHRKVASVPICPCPLMAVCTLALDIETTKHEGNLQILLDYLGCLSRATC